MSKQQADQVYRVGAMSRVLYDMERDINPGLQTAEKAGQADRWDSFVQERFGKFFNPRQRKLEEPAPGSEMIQKLHDICDEMPEPKQLEARTAGDEVLSGMAAASICNTIAARVEATQQAPRRDVKRLQHRLKGLEAMESAGHKVKKRIGKVKQQLDSAQAENKALADGVDPVTIRAAVREAVEQAQQEIDDFQEGVNAFSYGSEPGAPVRHNADAARAMANRLKGSPELQRIAKLAGRLRQEAAKKQKQKTDQQCSEISNVELGRDLCRLLPSELAAFSDPDLETDFYLRFSEGRLLQYKLDGNEAKGRGPIVFVLDESYSMNGSNNERAKAFAMGMLEIAQRQKRGWALVHFSSGVGRIDYCEPGKVKSGELMDCMEHFEGGGTEFTSALDAAVDIIEKRGGGMEKADVILVTDGVCDTSAIWDAKFKKNKAMLKFSVYSVLVQRTAWGTVGKWSNEVWPFEDMLKDSVKGRVFNI